MKIAVTHENGKVFQHFGHSSQFKIYDVENGEIVGSRVVGTEGQGHGALAALLKEMKAEVLICGGIGGGAKQALSENGIKLYGGVCGGCDEAVKALLSGKLAFDPDVKCSHHESEHGQGHACGEHGCGKNECH